MTIIKIPREVNIPHGVYFYVATVRLSAGLV